MKKTNISKVLMAIAMFIFGTLAPFVRNIDVSSGELALYRAVLAALFVGGFLLITRQKLPIGSIKKELLLLLLSGAAMGINWILLFEAYKYTTVSVATLSYYFAPVIVMVICPILFKERMTVKQILCFVMSTLGLVLITGTAGGGKQDLLGIAFGLGAAVFYATVMILNKFIKGVTGIQRTFVQFIAAIVVLVPYVIFTSGFTIGKLDKLGWGALLIVGLIHTGITYCMYFSALKELPGQNVAILSYIDPLVAVFVSVIWLSEKISIPQIIGGAMILGFTLWSELSISKSKEKKNMKILSIGNSFSADAHAYLHTIAEQNGVDLITVNLAIGGCSLQTHWENVEQNNANYLHSINGGDWAEKLVTIDEIIKSDSFDIVTVQQVSHFSGQYETYQPYLNNLVKYVREHQPNARLYFHKTWAYEIDSNHSQFSIYNCDQKKMYEAICNTSPKACSETGATPIPSGDVIQALRERLPKFDYANGGESLCCDGFHMSHTYGRYAVALTWLATLTRERVTPMPFKDLDLDIITKICDIVNEIVFEK